MLDHGREEAKVPGRGGRKPRREDGGREGRGGQRQPSFWDGRPGRSFEGGPGQLAAASRRADLPMQVRPDEGPFALLLPGRSDYSPPLPERDQSRRRQADARTAPALGKVDLTAGRGRRLLGHRYASLSRRSGAARHRTRDVRLPGARELDSTTDTRAPYALRSSPENCSPPRWVSAAKLVMAIRNLTRPFGPVSFIKLYQGQSRRDACAQGSASAEAPSG
jgi:hypothetical protein